MNIQGQITSITPDGGYQSQNGYINTFQMTIQAGDMTYTGQIGTKSQTYPLSVGSQINVVMTESEHGARFKKFNPQYASQGTPPTQQQPQQATQQPRQATNPPQRAQSSPITDTDLRIVRGNALNAIFSAMNISSDEVDIYLAAGVEWILKGQWIVGPKEQSFKEFAQEQDGLENL